MWYQWAGIGAILPLDSAPGDTSVEATPPALHHRDGRIAYFLSSCRQTAATPSTPLQLVPEVAATETLPPPTALPAITPTATPEPSPTPTPAPQLVVSQNTNCRSGPATDYPPVGVLAVGDVAEILARGPEPGYWFITGAGLPKDGCWLWGEYAQVEGAVDPLPVYTPAPSPTPAAGFITFLKGFADCDSTHYVVFAVQNTGGTRFWSGYVEIQDFSTRETIYSAKERHPFAAHFLPICPPDHGNELWPGETRYVHGELPEGRSGNTAIGMITLCTADYQGDWCTTQYSYFNIP